MKKTFLIFILLSCIGLTNYAYSQCTNCTYTAPSGGTNFNLNGNETLCITANASNLGWNMNGSGNKICVATGVVWDQPFGGNLQAGTVIEVYGTLNLGGGFNVNNTPPNAVINVHTGATLNHSGGFGNGITINNDGIVNFTSSAGIDVTGSFVLNNSATGTVNALTTTNFKLGNNATINNNGTLHFANFENEEGYLNNNVGATLLVDRSMNNHGAFINNGDFQIPCTALPGAAGATTCSFRVGDKGVGKEFITNTCIKINGNVTFDGPGTINSGFEIGSGYNLTINKTVTGTNGSILVKGGTSTINLSGNFIGTNMKFYDVNTGTHDFDTNVGNNPSSYSISSSAGCSVAACTPPTAVTATSNSPVSQGSTINLSSTSTGGTSYTWAGPNSFTSTSQNPTIASATTAMAGTYTVTVLSSGTCTATATVFVAVIKSVPCPNNKIVNGSFETTSSGSTAPYHNWYIPQGWNVGAAGYGETDWILPDGVGFLLLTPSNPVASQNVPVIVGNLYSLTFFTAMHEPLLNDGKVRMQYFDTSNNPVGTEQIHQVTYDWETTQSLGGPYNLNLPIAPTNANYIRIRLENNSSSTTEFIKFDAFCLSETCTPPTGIIVGSNSPVKEGSVINLSLTSTGGTSYSWAGPNGFTSTSQNPTIASSTTAMTGTYTVTVLSSGTCTATATVVVTVTPTVVCSITPTYTVTCNNQGTSDASDDKYDLVITVNGTNTPSGSFWQSNNASISSGAYGTTKNLTNFALISAGPVTVTFTDSQNSSCSNTIIITPPASCSPSCVWDPLLLNPPYVTVTVTRDCKGTTDESDDTVSGTFSVTGIPTGYTAELDRKLTPAGNDKESIATGITNNQIVNWGPYNVNNVKYPGQNGFVLWFMLEGITDCLGDYFVTIPECVCSPPTAVTAASNSPVNEGSTINLSSTSTGGTSYSWAGPNGFTSTIQNPTIASATTAMAGTYTVTVLSSGTCTATATVAVLVTPTTACPVTDYKLCAGESYTLTAQTGLTGYQWYTIVGTDTTAISGATNQIYTATTTGTFIWKAIDASGCDIKLCCPVVITPGTCYGSIGDYVWTDQNNNGQQDGTETPIAGVKVYLLDGSTGAKLDSALTDATGKYLFDSLTTGSYKVQFVAPTGTIASKQNTGADVTDSDANKLGISQIINIDTTKLPTDTLRNNPQIDAGFVPVGSIGDYVFDDKDKSNTQTAGDEPLAGVKVYLLDGTTGAKLDSVITDAAGKYLFDSLLAGSYKVQFVAPDGTKLVTKTSGTDVTKDSNPDPTTGITDAVTIDTTKPLGDPARDNRDVDAGIQIKPSFGSLGDYVWTDTNNNGQQDSGEAPIAGVKVYLYDGTGTTKLDSTITDALGKYTFDSLITGSYKVYFQAPAGMISAKQNTGADVTDSDVNKLGWSQVVNIDASLADTDTLRNNPQIDAGFVPVGSIGDYVFNDKDNSNTQTAGDTPIEGVKVYLLDATTGAKLDSTLTDASGLYKFDSLVAGNYKVQFVIPTGMTAVPQDSGSDDTKDSDINSTGQTGSFTVDTTKPIGDPARDITSVDAGLKGIPQYGSLGDYVWSDVNNNGQQDGTEAPIAGVKVYLYDGTGTSKLDSTVTDALGKYTFDSLLTGSYKVYFKAPVGTMPSKQNTGADVTDSDANKLGWSQVVNIDVTKLATDTLRNNPQIDAGFVPVGSIGDYVFDDKDKSNTQTAGDEPLAGVKVYLLDGTTGAKSDSAITDAAGKYLFDSLTAGSYKVQFVAPVGTKLVTKTSGTDVTKDSNPDPTTGITDAVTIDTTQPLGSPARDNRDVDAGVQIIPQYGSLGDYVWTDQNNNGQQDSGEAPIAGVKVYLYDGTGSTKLDSTVTDALGKYTFDSLLTGSYKVYFKAPAGTISAKQNTGADVTDSDANKLGWSQVVNIDATKAATDTLRNNPQIDAGFVPVGSIGDYVFNDKDNSNTQTAGDTPIEGVKVYLLDATTGAKLDSTFTDATGLYKFDSLVAGNYKVQFVIPTGMTAVTPDSGTDDSKDSDINSTGQTGSYTVDTTKPIGDPARDITSVDAGLKGVPQYGSLGDYVWSDVNNNGQQDGTESPIAGVKVYLYDGTGTTKLDSTVTDALGKYTFDSLFTGSYKVYFKAPVGTIPSKQNIGADVSDSDANKLGWSQVINIDVTKLATDTLRNNPQIDAGFVPVGSIGDYVFEDKDNSNTQTAGDEPVACIKVYLLDATTGAKLDSTVTDAAGKYLFDSLTAGNYKVQFVAPVGTNLVTKTSGTDVTKDSNPNPTTGITDAVTIDTTQPLGSPARDNRDVDAGLKINGPFGSIGDYVWLDTDNDGQQDGTETPLAGVKVFLYDATLNMLIDSTITNSAGKYLFDSLLTGKYQIKFAAPDGTIPAKQNTGGDVTDSDANNAGWSQIVNIDTSKPQTDTLRNNPQIDAGFVPFGSIGDYVFLDKDNSNTQTAGDLPVAGVKVYLLNAVIGAKLDSTITDGSGLYKFDSLVAGNYKVQFVVPSGTLLVSKNSGTDATKDSNPDPTTGITDALTVDTTKPIGDPARDVTTVDAGIKPQLQYGSIGDYVWMDTNNDGQQGSTEAPIAGVKVYLYDGAGTTKLDSAITDAAGKYLFDSLITGSYKVYFKAPAGTIAAKQNTGADVTDSDANGAGWSQVVNIDVTKATTDTLRNNPQIDAGFVPVGSIGDYVFSDKDGSNTQTAGDEPVSGIKVYLLDATTGAKLDSTITDGSGLYKFDSLLAGSYKVQFVAPNGTTLVDKNSGTDTTKDSNADPLTGMTDTVVIDTTQPIGSVARDNMTVDAGIEPQLQYGSIGDYVWSDTDKDGQQDAGEPPIAGVTVKLYDATGATLIATTITDAAGKYLFDSLITGSYKVYFETPVKKIATSQNTGSDVSDSDINSSGWSQVVNIDVTLAATDTLRNNPQIDAGFVPLFVDVAVVKQLVGTDCKYQLGDNVKFLIKVKRQDLVNISVSGISIKDSLSTYLDFVSASTTNGTFNTTTKIWSGITLAAADSAILEVNAKIKNVTGNIGGLMCNEAWLLTMNADDFDSQAGNTIETEDDFSRACVSVPLKICQQRNEKVELYAPSGYTTYQWYNASGQPIAGATSQTYLATQAGSYTVRVNGNNCPNSTCCPIYIEDFCDCPPAVCIPYVVKKVKKQ